MDPKQPLWKPETRSRGDAASGQLPHTCAPVQEMVASATCWPEPQGSRALFCCRAHPSVDRTVTETMSSASRFACALNIVCTGRDSCGGVRYMLNLVTSRRAHWWALVWGPSHWRSRTVETDGEHALSHEGLSAVLMQWLPWLRAASAASQRADAPPAHNVPTVTSVHRHASRAEGGLPLMVMGWV